MDDPLAMGLGQCQRQFPDNRGDRFLIQGLAHVIGKRAPLDKCHGDVMPSIDFTDIVNGADVRVSQIGGSPSLAIKPLDQLFIFIAPKGRRLQSDLPIQFAVVGQVDRTHGSRTQSLLDFVTTEGLR